MIIKKVLDFKEAPEIYNETSEIQLKRINEPQPGIFIAESPKVIIRALNAGYEPISVLLEDGAHNEETSELLNRLNDFDITVYLADKEILTRITGYNLTRGALCAMKRKKLLSLNEICKGAQRIAVLEDVVNPTNVGAIFRSAAALGMDAVVLTDTSSDPLYRRSLRVSMGTVFQIPWTMLDVSKESLTEQLHAMEYKTVAFALRNNSVDITAEELKQEPRLAIIMGTEGEGLKAETIDDSDWVVKIPMTHDVDSLNVAAASAVAFWELSQHK